MGGGNSTEKEGFLQPFFPVFTVCFCLCHPTTECQTIVLIEISVVNLYIYKVSFPFNAANSALQLAQLLLGHLNHIISDQFKNVIKEH